MKCSSYRKDFPPFYLCNFMTLKTRVRGQKMQFFFSKTLWSSILSIDPKTSSNMQKDPKSFSVHPTAYYLFLVSWSDRAQQKFLKTSDSAYERDKLCSLKWQQA